MQGTVLVADDDRAIRTVLTKALTRAGCTVHATATLVTLRQWVAEGRGDLVITDVMMPDGNGLDLLPDLISHRPDLPVIVISAQNTVLTALRAEEAKAWDYLPKPFDLPDLLKRVSVALKPRMRAPEPDESDLPLAGESDPMQALFRSIAKAANLSLPVLITGESGAGKSHVARVLHDMSARKGRTFVALTADDLSAHFDSGMLARAGTVVFEDLERLPDTAQRRALQLIDAAPRAGLRVIGTCKDSHSVAEELLYRLHAVAIRVPPLRECRSDIALHAARILGARGIEADAQALLDNYDWPGNLRQLDMILRGLDAITPERALNKADVRDALAHAPGVQTCFDPGESLGTAIARHLQTYFDQHGENLPPVGLYDRVLREMETPLIEITLDATRGNQAKSAAVLGINRNTLRKKILDLDIEVTRCRKLM